MTNALVIDDDDDFLNSFCALLEVHDISVVGQGRNGKQAVDMYLNLNPDVTFLDIMMPGDDGIKAARIIKSFKKDVRIIVVTSDVTFDTHEKLSSLGITDIIYKPINMKKVLDAISRHPLISE